MRGFRTGRRLWVGVALCLAVLLPAEPGAWAKPEPEHLRIVGGLAGVNQFVRQESPFWLRDVPRLTGGMVTTEIVPSDQAGLGAADLLRAIQIGAVPFGTVSLSTASTLEPEFAAPDLAGLSPDMESVRTTVAAYRPRLAGLLKQKYGIELLAVYAYPAQVVFCAKAFQKLSDLAGRRVRVSSATQADFVLALGAQPVQTPFAQVVSSIKSGTADCAITGTMSGNTIGLHEVTSHIHPLAVNWGLAAFVVQIDRWRSLQPAVREVIARELPTLERAIWAESARETEEGLSCNIGSSVCRGGRKGSMKVVAATAADDKLRLDLLHRSVLPAWLRRCDPECLTQWQQTIGRNPDLRVR